jgi:hypothetical protein
MPGTRMENIKLNKSSQSSSASKPILTDGMMTYDSEESNSNDDIKSCLTSLIVTSIEKAFCAFFANVYK